jgi:hypothetical protein
MDLTNLAPADLKGWMTLQQVIDGVGISQADLYRLANIPADLPTSTALKDLEPLVPDFEVSTLREKLAEWAATEPQPTAETTVPTAAPAATPAPSTTAPVANPTVTAVVATHAAGSGGGTGTGPTPLPAGQILPANQIKGRMTLQQVSDQCAVPLDALLKELSLPANTNPNTAIKDLVSQGALSEVTQVQDAVAKLQN